MEYFHSVVLVLLLTVWANSSTTTLQVNALEAAFPAERRSLQAALKRVWKQKQAETARSHVELSNSRRRRRKRQSVSTLSLSRKQPPPTPVLQVLWLQAPTGALPTFMVLLRHISIALTAAVAALGSALFIALNFFYKRRIWSPQAEYCTIKEVRQTSWHE